MGAAAVKCVHALSRQALKKSGMLSYRCPDLIIIFQLFKIVTFADDTSRGF